MRADAGVQIVGFHLAPVSTALTLFFSWAPLLVIGEAALDQRWPRADELVGLGAYAVGISLLMMSDTPATKNSSPPTVFMSSHSPWPSSALKLGTGFLK